MARASVAKRVPRLPECGFTLYMHPELVDTLDERVRQVVINWPRLVVDALEERIDLQSSGGGLAGRQSHEALQDIPSRAQLRSGLAAVRRSGMNALPGLAEALSG